VRKTFAPSLIIAAFSIFITPASAAYYSLTTVGLGGVAPYAPPCYCADELAHYSPIYVYTYSPGVTINFGQFSVGWFPQTGISPDGGPNQLPVFLAGSYGTSNGSVLPNLITDAALIIEPPNFTVNLGTVTFETYGSGSIQYAVAGPAQYSILTLGYSAPTQIAAVPEPSTWAMMLIGFAGIGAMAYHRRKGAMLAV
jgi:hypothetical protein